MVGGTFGLLQFFDDLLRRSTNTNVPCTSTTTYVDLAGSGTRMRVGAHGGHVACATTAKRMLQYQSLVDESLQRQRDNPRTIPSDSCALSIIEMVSRSYPRPRCSDRRGEVSGVTPSRLPSREGERMFPAPPRPVEITFIHEFDI
jgi:hypothetical protein